MSISNDIILKFNNLKNVNFFFTEDDKKFLIAEIADSTNIPAEQRFLLDTYPEHQEYLKIRFTVGLRNDYEILDTLPDIIAQDFQISNYSENLVIIYYFAEVETKLTLRNKSLSPNDISILKNNLASSLTSISLKNIESGNVFYSLTNSDFPPDYRTWNYCKLKLSDNNAKEALDKILKLKNRKGMWITKEADDFNTTTIQNTPTLKLTRDLTVKNLESYLTIEKLETLITKELYKPNLVVESFNSLEPSLFLEENASTYGPIGVFVVKESMVNSLNDKSFTYNDLIVGFPEEMLNLFPLILQTDKKNQEIDTTVSYFGLDELESKIETLKNIISEKLSLLTDSFKVRIDNYDPEELITQVESFIKKISSEIENKKINSTIDNLNFSFRRTKCKPSDQFCNKIFVDGQTNLKLENTVLNNKVVINPISSDIDERLSASFLLRCDEIIRESEKKNAKQFFKFLYDKAIFVPYQGLVSETSQSFKNSTFVTIASRNAEKAFISDPVNIFNQYKAKVNINKIINNSVNVPPSQTIEETLREVRNLKQLYRSILDKYHLSDLVDSVISCYVSPSFQDLGLTFIENKIKTLLLEVSKNEETAQQDLKTLSVCLGLLEPIPFPIPPDWTPKIATNDPLDFFLTNSIKCFDSLERENVKNKIKDLNLPKVEVQDPINKNKKIVLYDLNFLKGPINQQYDLIVQQAKTYRKAPSVEDEIKSSAALGKENISISDFSILLLRNSWVLLQEQLEKEIESAIVSIWIQIIQSLLDKVKENCDGSENKNEASKGNKQGDLNFAGTPKVSETDNSAAIIDELINELSSLFKPSELCSLFKGEASQSTLKDVLKIIEEKYPSLYVGPVIIKGIKYSDSLSSVSSLRQFFILFSNQFTEFEKKCNDYAEKLSNEKYPVSEKCIDFSPEYKQNRINKLVSLGLTKEQAETIVKNEIKQKNAEYAELLLTSENGVYNEAKKQMDKQEIKVSEQTKKSIDNSINSIITSYVNLLSSYKKEIFNIQNTLSDFNPALTIDGVSKYTIANQQIEIIFNEQENIYEPSYKFKNEYGIVYQSKNYSTNEQTKKLGNIKLLLDIIINKSGLNIDQQEIFINPVLNSFLSNYRIQIVESINKKFSDYQKTDFEKTVKNNMLSDINSFINFKE